MTDTSDTWALAGRTFRSRIIIGTGKFASHDETRAAIDASGAEMVTVALRRVDLSGAGPNLLDAIDRARLVLLPNTAGCYTVEDAVRTCHLARELGMDEFVKLEVIGDPKTLFPDNAATVEAARILVKEGFTVLPYCGDDLITCKRLIDAGCPAVMPLAAPIGSGLGIRNPHNLKIIIDEIGAPVIVDAGVGTASDAAIAMELGATAVLMNTGIAAARQPVLMAEAMRLAVDAGRKAFRAGRMAMKAYANASSPVVGLIE
ncbi:MAG: thiazole synthase [Myxococcales bacterium]|nr:thiazole synthase [Myxococcales bacterium]